MFFLPIYFPGTQHYCPPEFYSHRCFHGNHATVWQLGFLLAEMLSNEMPYVKPRMALYMRPSVPKFVSNGKNFGTNDTVGDKEIIIKWNNEDYSWGIFK